MKLELLCSMDNAKGRGFKKGDVVDWPRRDALPLIQAGLAREPKAPAPSFKRKPKRARKVEVEEVAPEPETPEEEE